MKYYSDLTNKIYNTEKELNLAESDYKAKLNEKKEKEEERKNAYKAVKQAFDVAEQKRKEAETLLRDFLKKYETVHETTDGAKIIRTHQDMEAQKDLINLVFTTFPYLIF